MNGVSKIIFNAIVSKVGINLPQIGSLLVHAESAKFETKNTLFIPVNKIIFSKSEKNNLKSVVELIGEVEGVDPKDANKIYTDWLAKIKRDGDNISIEGIGEIKNGIFNPSPNLTALLRPQQKKYIKIKKRGSARKILKLIIPVILIALIAAGLCFYRKSIHLPWFFADKTGAPTESHTYSTPQDIIMQTGAETKDSTRAGEGFGSDKIAVEMEDVDTETDGSESGSKQTARSETKVTTDQRATNDVDNKSKESQDEKNASGNTAFKSTSNGVTSTGIYSPGKFYVVAGVYSTVENADKYITKAQTRNRGAEFEKIPLRNGKILVSLYTGDTEQEANAKRKEYRVIASDLWIYKAK